MAGKSAVTLRLGVEGDEKIQAALRKIGQTGDAAFAGLSKEAKEAARSFDRLEKSVDAQARSAAQVARAYVSANQAIAAGVRTQADAQRVVDLAAEKHRRLTGAVNDNSDAIGLNRMQMMESVHVAKALVDQIIAGQSPAQAFAIEGGRIAQIFSSGTGGAGATMAAFGNIAIRALTSPVGIAATLAAGILGVKVAGDAAAASLAKLGEEAQQTGLTPNRVAGAKIVGARAGLDDKGTIGAFTNAQKEFEAFSRNSGAVKDSLDKIDKGFLNVADRARNAGEWIDRIVQKIRELPRAQGLNLAQSLFGQDEGRKLFDEIASGAVSMASLGREAEKAGANFDASAEHAAKMRKEIAEIDTITSTRLLATFGDLADPVLAMEKSWANMKLGILDVERSARQLRDTLRFKSGELLGEQGEAASTVFARMRQLRANGGRDPFAGKTMADVDPLVNLFTQSDPKSRPRAVGDTRKLFETTKKTGKSDAEKSAAKFTDIEASLKNQIALVASQGVEHDKIALKIKIENEQLKLGTAATQEQKDKVAGLVTQLNAATKEASLYKQIMDEANASVKDAAHTLVSGLQQGNSLGKSLKDTLASLATKGLNKGIDTGIDSIFAALKGGSGGSGNIISSLASLFGGSGGAAGAASSAGSIISTIATTAMSLFALEDGGVMTSRGPLPLRRYAGGGIADSPQLAMFGEGRMPEAYVPLPDGRSIPVAMSGGNAPKITINNNAPVDVTPRVMSDGEIILHVDRRIASFGKQLAEAPRRANR
ncbi:MAG: hypothetical protein ACR65T_09620 [Methylocystis sp.]|uniref:hypothetical protein n=1 Tax=Methylocystis sp. TaxID=1911079 RepID=UPI003DA376CE